MLERRKNANLSPFIGDNCSEPQCSIFIKRSRAATSVSHEIKTQTKARKDQSVQNRSRLITLSPDIECTCSFVSIIGNDSLAKKGELARVIEPQSKSRFDFSNRFTPTSARGLPPAVHLHGEKCFDVSIKTSPGDGDGIDE
jgi:hypothetical protein